MNVHPLVRENQAAHFYTEGQWHRTESYPDQCKCGVPVSGHVKPALDEQWKYAPPQDLGVCMDAVTKFVRATLTAEGGMAGVHGGPMVGDRVEFVDKQSASLYELGKAGEWFLEGVGVRTEDDPAPVARLIDRRTQVQVHAPLAWIKQWVPPVLPKSDSVGFADPNPAKPIRVGFEAVPSTDDHITCVICSHDGVTHEFMSRTNGKRSVHGLHEVCVRSIHGWTVGNGME